MQVLDTKCSERGPQRRRDANGRALHSCCVCGKTETWGPTWSAYYSWKDLDDKVRVPKFCSDKCKSTAGPKAKNITEAQIAVAHEHEMRPPRPAYRDATASEKYRAAVERQRPRS